MTGREIELSDAQNLTIETIKEVYAQLSSLDSVEIEPGELPDAPVIVITGLSGVGKSTLVSEVKRLFPVADSNTNDEVLILLVNTHPLIIIQDSLTSSSFNPDGKIKTVELSTTALWSLSEPNKKLVSQKSKSSDVLRVTQRTLTISEANELISCVDVNPEISIQLFNELTLGIPKLINECAGKSQDEIIQHVAWYLSKCMYQLQDLDSIRMSIQTIQESFLSPDRSIPVTILKEIPKILSIWKSGGIYSNLLRRYKDDRDGTIFRALQKIHPETRTYYSGQELGWSTSFTLKAWIDTSDVNFQILEAELDSDRPDFSRPELGNLGKLLMLFKLHRSIVGFESRSTIAGGATKSRFGFNLVKDNQTYTLGNTMGRSLFPETSLNMSQSSPFARAYAQMHSNPPNFIVEVWDHDVIGPAQAMGGLEAVMQSLGIRYQVTHPDDNMLLYNPENVSYQRILPQDELLRRRREDHNNRTKSKKKKK